MSGILLYKPQKTITESIPTPTTLLDELPGLPRSEVSSRQRSKALAPPTFP
ncbi:MAG: hypothetical protein QOH48_2353 [Actinomycetota bacterium]|jgi:hypothetical protein|nr:hypothetical protein [Actinomycetota bacterium]